MVCHSLSDELGKKPSELHSAAGLGKATPVSIGSYTVSQSVRPTDEERQDEGVRETSQARHNSQR